MSKQNPEFIWLHDPHAFDGRFLEKTRQYDTYEEAYDAVEEEYRSTFGAPKYSNYESYRVTRRYRIKRRMEKTVAEGSGSGQ
jgi:hypothetical protein